MTFKTYKELTSMNEKELMKEKDIAGKYKTALSFEKSQGNVKDTSQFNKLKTYGAWIETILALRKTANAA